MKILFVSPYAPTPIRTRPYHFLKFLAQRGHEITLATLFESSAEAAALTSLEGFGIRILAHRASRRRTVQGLAQAVFAGEPLQARYSWDLRLAGDLAAALSSGQPDVVHVEHLRGAVYVRSLKSLGIPVPVVWDSVDSISHLFAQASRSSASRFGRMVSRLELNRTRRYERRMVRTAGRVIVTSEVDRQALMALAGDVNPGHICVVHNGVDPEKFYPIDGPVQPDTILFTGKMSYHANVTAAVRFAAEVMPLIWKERPGVRLQIVGKDPARQVRHLGVDRRVDVVGEVAELRPYLGVAAVAVAPIAYGAGVQNKVLEAMACRTAVVASPQAVSALQFDQTRPVLVAGSPEAFARAVLSLLEDPAARAALARAGYAYVQRHHQWTDAAAQLERIYHEIIQSSH